MVFELVFGTLVYYVWPALVCAVPVAVGLSDCGGWFEGAILEWTRILRGLKLFLQSTKKARNFPL